MSLRGTRTLVIRTLRPNVACQLTASPTVRQFVYDPASGSSPPPGFGGLLRGASTAPGLLGLPLPATRAPTIGWDEFVEALILSRLGDQAVGRLVVI